MNAKPKAEIGTEAKSEAGTARPSPAVENVRPLGAMMRRPAGAMGGFTAARQRQRRRLALGGA
jgi:hypothetical protein